MLKPYFGIMTLRCQAHDLPYNPLAIVLWLVLDFALVLLVVSTLGEKVAANIGLEIFDVTFSAAAIWLLLWLHKHKARFVQAYTALLGVNVILFGALVAITLLFRNPNLFGFLAQPVYLWFLVVFGFILKDALEVSTFKAILWVVAIEFTRLLVLIQFLKGAA